MKNKILVQLIVSFFFLVTLVQQLYWPIIMRSDSELSWWQNYYLAKIGFYTGGPIWIALFRSPFKGLSNKIFIWISILIWIFFIFWITGVIVNFFKRLRTSKKEN